MNSIEKRSNLLVTGPPGCGKSTLIINVLGKIDVPARGFTTAEIRSGRGERQGFRITSLSGREGILAHREVRTGPRLGRYRINLKDLDEIGTAEIEAALDDPSTRLVVVDEIARMEMYSNRFRRAVIEALDSAKALLGTIQKRSDPFLDGIRSRPDTLIIPIERRNRGAAENGVLSELTRILKIKD